MTYQDYVQLFEEILGSEHPQAPYSSPDYMAYTRLNYSRMSRWWKTLQLDETLVQFIKGIDQPQQWIIIAEPWCGDAAPSVPFMVRLAMLNPNIQYDVQLRDQEPFLINNYLTNGTKSIPKLVVRNEAGQDLFSWGPRPAGAQELVLALKAANADFESLKVQLQNWYNTDKGHSIQHELLQLLQTAMAPAGAAAQ